MRILLVTSNLSLRSGVASVLVNYIKNCDRTKNTFSIAFYDKVFSSTYEEELTQLDVHAFYLPRKAFLSNLRKFNKEHFGEFDIIHINDPYLAFCFIGIKRKLGVKKVVFHTHSTKFSDTYIKGIRNRVLSIPSRFIADHLFACSETAGVITFGKKFKSKGTVIYNAIDLEKFHFCENDRNLIRQSLYIEREEVIGHVGNMTPPKNHLFVIDIFKEYLKINENSKLLLIGDGYLKNKIKEKIKNLGIEDHVIFTGVVSNVYAYMSAMDKFLFPSLFEGLGIVLIEAQVNGLPCLYSDVVPVEADINIQKNKKLSLKVKSKIWANELCSLENRTNSIIQNESYNIKFASARLLKLYEDILHEK